jgi:hypothetical protein
LAIVVAEIREQKEQLLLLIGAERKRRGKAGQLTGFQKKATHSR